MARASKKAARQVPASVICLDLVKHSSRAAAERDTIRAAVDGVLEKAARLLQLDPILKHTGDGYFAVLEGASSARAVDYLNGIVPSLGAALRPHDQAFRIGVDFGILVLARSAATGRLEHFDEPGIEAARLESVATPNECLCSRRFHAVFSSRYRHSFSDELTTRAAKDRQISGYAFASYDAAALREAIRRYVVGAVPRVTRRRNVLLIDDDRAVVDMFGDLLRAEGWSVTTATSSEDALAVLAERPFAVMLTDLVMPGLGGLDLARTAGRHHPDMVIVAFTGYPRLAPDPDDLTGEGSDFVSVIPKGGVGSVELLAFLDMVVDADVLDFSRRSVSGRLTTAIRRGLLAVRLEATGLQEALTSPDLAAQFLEHKRNRLLGELLDGLVPAEEFRRRLEETRAGLAALNRFARIVRTADETPLEGVLREYVRETALRRNATCSVRVSLDEAQLARVRLRWRLLLLAVAELVDNAGDAVSQRGTIRVTVTASRRRKEIVAAVEDSGPGLPVSRRAAAFRGIPSSKGPGRGRGLGLVADAAEILGGTVEYIRSKRTRVQVVVPLA
jgi:CheY-like chemotaxis protein/two-component sensor histidine kinase